MTGYNLSKIYWQLADLGVVKSRRDYCRYYLRRGLTYFNDYVQRDRDHVRVSDRTVRALRDRLTAVARHCSPTIVLEIEGVITEIDAARDVADRLGYRGRGAAVGDW